MSPIVQADLKPFSPASRPEDDIATGGGARDVDYRPSLTQLAANDIIEVLSSAAGDTTQNVTIDGRDAAGAFVTEVLGPLTGVTPVIGSQTFERILSVDMDADAVGTVTVRRSPSEATIYVIPIAERGSYSQFIKAASQAGAVTRHDKLFWLNDHATLTLNDAKVQLTADPASRIRQGIAATKDDTATIANRLAVPGGITFVDDSVQQNVPGTTLEAAAAIGVWIEQALLAADASIRSTFTDELAGTSV